RLSGDHGNSDHILSIASSSAGIALRARTTDRLREPYALAYGRRDASTCSQPSSGRAFGASRATALSYSVKADSALRARMRSCSGLVGVNMSAAFLYHENKRSISGGKHAITCQKIGVRVGFLPITLSRQQSQLPRASQSLRPAAHADLAVNLTQIP